jgi:hypothetical protein
LSFNPTTRTFSGTPTNDDVGNLSLKVTATDNAGASVSNTFGLAIANTNDAPIVQNAIADQNAIEDSAFSFIVPANTFSDADLGDTLTYSVTLANSNPLPTWLNFNPTTRTFSGTPTNGDVGNLSLKVTATDIAGASVSSSFGLAIANTNDVPIVQNAIADQNVIEDAVFSFIVPANTFSDVDLGDTLTYSAILTNGDPLPSWLTFNTTTRAFSGTPTNSDVGNLSLKITATDSAGANVSNTFGLAIANTNDAPIVQNAIADQNAIKDAVFSFTIPINTFSDVDAGDSLTYSATLANGNALPTWLIFNSVTRTFSGTPATADLATLTIKVSAIDNAGAAATDTFSLTVNPISNPTDGTPGADSLIGTDRDDTFNGGAGNDTITAQKGNDTLTGGGDRDTFVWAQESSPPGVRLEKQIF